MGFRIVGACWGPEKTGKSTLGLSFPSPIHYINYDYGIEDLLGRYPEKEIIVHNIGAENPFDLAALLGETPKAPLMKKVLVTYRDAIKQAAEVGGSVIVDTFGQMRQTISDGTIEEVLEKRVGTKSEGQVFPFDYSKSNAITSEVIRMAYKVENVNLFLIHRAAPVYNSAGQDTGAIKMQGWHEVPAAVAVTLRTFRDPKGEFKMRIESCRKDGSLAGTEYGNPSYETLRLLLED